MTSNQSPADTIKLAQQLIQQPSVTPEDFECQALLAEELAPFGFSSEQLDSGDVKNLWSRKGTTSPFIVFAGHTDVVPTGPLEQWQHPPFDGVIAHGILHGRGASDMKGSIASFVTASQRFIQQHPDHKGSIGFLITSDEEGPAIHGTKAALKILQERDEAIEMCIVGEPTSSNKTGDIIKVGRRGSLGATLKIIGKQGHIAYPDQANNPIHLALPFLNALINIEWDQGNENFQPTSLQISNINAGTGATNVIPGDITIVFNIRYSPEVTNEFLQRSIEGLLQKYQIQHEIEWRHSGQPFETKQGPLVQAVSDSIDEVLGYFPEQSTSGGTSDGRFISPTGAQVVELGPVNATIHQINEQIDCADLERLSQCYQRVLEKLLL